ncbi:CotH protein [Ruminococcus sp. YE71]|uniref:CotH kinase family protein n=1 Tax=unclassified Ruminococcus TaxID=2608920 RepID=UPI00088710CA|nr:MULTISPECIES: CotH kinase family protein [unclassified Ruminococcus]SDA19828.1 CotH protein [Ruminococcus sp. YE78]SFW31444.1 CotH protein [Ruminococcus sp. YE71]
MKRAAAFITALVLVLSFSACSASETSEKKGSSSEVVTLSEKNGTEESAGYAEKLFGGEVLDISIETTADDWSYLMENAASKPWISGNITVNGTTLENVGIKTKGNTSLNQLPDDSQRYSLKINFGKYEDGQTCFGLDKLVLNNLYSDSTYLKEYLSYDLFRFMDVPASLCTFAKITVNGEYYGFFIAIEDTDDSFIERNYGTDSGVTAYKPESMDMGGFGKGGGKPDLGDMPDGFDPENMQLPDGFDPEEMKKKFGQTGEDGERPEMPGGFGDGKNFMMNGGRDGVSLVYTDDSADSYSNIFDNDLTKTTEEEHERLIASLKAISEGKDLESCINVDEVLRYTACNVFLVNLDSYFSMMGHNYVLTESDGVLSMLPWDYNLSFGTYQGESADSVINYAVDTVFNGVSAEDRPIIGKLLEKEEYREKYHEYLRQIAEEYIQSGLFSAKLDQLNSLIGSYVESDTTSFDGYDAYCEGIDALKLFGQLRAQSVLGQLDGSIPSTTEEQKNSDSLVDASSLDMKKLGQMNMGMRGGKGFGRKKDRTDSADSTESKEDKDSTES